MLVEEEHMWVQRWEAAGPCAFLVEHSRTRVVPPEQQDWTLQIQQREELQRALLQRIAKEEEEWVQAWVEAGLKMLERKVNGELRAEEPSWHQALEQQQPHKQHRIAQSGESEGYDAAQHGTQKTVYNKLVQLESEGTAAGGVWGAAVGAAIGSQVVAAGVWGAAFGAACGAAVGSSIGGGRISERSSRMDPGQAHLAIQFKLFGQATENPWKGRKRKKNNYAGSENTPHIN
eukprot:817341-Pelagomonas_calceolata.AAC.1